MRRAAPALAAAILATTLVLVAPPAPVTADPAGDRYLSPVFTDVTVTTDVLYRTTTDYLGNPIQLRLDVYEPAGDPVAERPAVVWMHGGWFAFGSKDGMGSVAEEYARRGFVVFMIDYRVNPDNGWDTFSSIYEAMADGPFLQSVIQAMQDARAAVAFVRANAATYRADPDAIVAGGHSAGGVLALLLAYAQNDAHNPADADYASRIEAALVWSGAVLTFMIQPGEPPSHIAHGTADRTIPYSHGQEICAAITADGMVCDFQSLRGVGHTLSGYRAEIVEDEAHFLFDLVLAPLGYTTGWPPPTTTTTTSTTTTTVPGSSSTSSSSSSSTTSSTTPTTGPATTSTTSGFSAGPTSTTIAAVAGNNPTALPATPVAAAAAYAG